MDLRQAKREALAAMEAHGLTALGWTLVFDNAKTRAGVCRPSKKQIGLSRLLTPLQSDEAVRDTILHEIAHALVGTKHGHDRVWQRKAIEIGSNGKRCFTAAPGESVPAAWVGTCPAGHTANKHRTPTRVTSCSTCRPGAWDARFLYKWKKQGRTVPMGQKYRVEIARLQDRGLVAA